jgi:hypothetical protein
MADTKISALPASTTPLAGTEVLPIVQSSTTKQVTVANLTAGRSFDALGMTLTSTDAGAAAAPLLELYRDSATPATSDTLGEIEFNGEDSAGNKQAYGLIHASILSPTSTAEQGQLHFETATAGALTEKMIIGTTNLVINEIGAVFNVRIEGDTDANLFYTDATNSRIGVGTISPAAKLDVVGTVGISSTTTLSGLTASTALALNASKEVVSVTNTGTGNNVLATSPTLATPKGVQGSITLGPGSGDDFKSGGTFMGFGSWNQNVTVVAIDYQYIQAVLDATLEVIEYKVGGAGAVTFATFTGTAGGTRTGTYSASISVTAGTRFFVGVSSTFNGNQSNCNFVIHYVTA